MAVYSSLNEPVRNDVLAVGTSTVKLAESRNDLNPRITLLVRNNSPNATDIITICQGQQGVVTNAGIVLRQYESFTDSSSEGYVAYQGVWLCICATATGSLSIMER